MSAYTVQTVVTLSAREAKFVEAMALHGYRPTRAATEAGYAVATAKELLRKSHVRAAIHQVAANAAAAIERIAYYDSRYGAPDTAAPSNSGDSVEDDE